MSAPVDTGDTASAHERAAVEALLPHRAPFLFVDAVTARGEGFVETRFCVPPDADWFRGHYPGQPIMPGVLVCEHVFQSAAILVGHTLTQAERGSVPVLTRIESARFRRVVRPADVLATRVSLRARTGPAFECSGEVRCAGERVLSVQFVVATTGGMAALEV